MDLRDNGNLEQNLAEFAEEVASIGGYITAWKLSKDVYMKNYYVTKAIEQARKDSSRHGYARAYVFCKCIGRLESANQLRDEMKEKHPFYLFFMFPLLNLIREV
ncbi:MAG: hypothetical protein Q7S27_03475 [Nanoarchaeota archaeon]|nr:hypothetical protein [Nanoarchaeota archaeon]